MAEKEIKFCSNCKREIPAGNFVMHNVHCQRKLSLCPKCDEPVPRHELAAHNTNLHAIVDCQACGTQLEKRLLAEHQKSSCSRREICCAYCHIETEASELGEHENYCGSRTERCEDCKEFVMLKYLQLHLDSNHSFLKLEDEPGPTPSWAIPRAPSNGSSLLNDLSRQRKVSNASQDAGRPTSASNRLSPSKRTNDMPQLNSASTRPASKDVHKAVITQDDGGVDIDRLLALRLAEQERTSSSLLSRPSAPSESTLRRQPGGDLVALPCEFCDAMVPANQLVLHETGCRPELTHFDSPLLRGRKPVDTPEEEGLPCEFCLALFPPNLLLQHEEMCEVTGVLANQLGPQYGCRKKLYLTGMGPPGTLFPPRRNPSPTDPFEDPSASSPYLNEMRASLRKPTASIPPAGRNQLHDPAPLQPRDLPEASNRIPNFATGRVNGYVRRPTGAVPKQKAGKRVGIREVNQEVPRASAATVSPQTGRLRYGAKDLPR